MLFGTSTFTSKNEMAEAMDDVSTKLLELMDKPAAWQWVFSRTHVREKGGKLELKNAAGQVAATVFLYPGASEMFKYVWFVWDQGGTGGENSAEPTVDEAIREAEAAVRRWGQFDITTNGGA